MRVRAAFLAAALSASAVPALADPASEALLTDFIAHIDGSSDWSASAAVVRSEGADTIAEAVVLSRQDPNVSVAVDRLRLRDLRSQENGGFSAAEIEMTGAGVLTEDSDIDVPTLSVKDISVPGADDLSYDPRHIMTFVGRLYSVLAEAEFSDLHIPEISALPTEDAGAALPDARFVYRNLQIPRLQDGIVERAQAGPILFEQQNADGAVRVELETVATERFDLGTAAHMFDESRYRDGRGDQIWRPLVARIGYSGLTVNSPDGTQVRIADAAMENLDGRQTEQPLIAVWDRVLDPALPEEARAELALETVQAMVSAWRTGTMRLDGFTAANPQNATSIGFGAFTITGISHEGIDSLILSNLNVETPDGSGELESFELAGFTFPDSEALIRFAALEADAPAAEHEETVRAMLAALPRLGHLGIHGLSFEDGEIRTGFDLFTLDFRNFNDLFAEETELRIEGLEVPVDSIPLEPEQAKVMDTLGYDRLVLGTSLSNRWSPPGNDDATWTFELQDGVEVELDYRLSGLTVDWVVAATAAAAKEEDSEAALRRMLDDLRLDRARLTVTDRSLLDRGFAVAAEQQGLTVDGKTYREQMRGALPFLLSAVVPGALSKVLTPPLQDFLAGGQKLVTEITPPAPLPLSELEAAAGDPASVVERLGLTVRSEAPPQ